jgi:death-on-curing protein
VADKLSRTRPTLRRGRPRLCRSLFALLGIARNHPFGQGNKRAAFAAAQYFLFLNGWEFTHPDRTALADRVVDLITGELDEDEFVDLIRGHARRL